ncbi:MAG: response regulator transcription factor [Cyanobacteria bacterium K_Offshore_surface_m2_239]|nr:response regulator transcription factor [Cyanobacteria bacterium K_Offshore_surface_m2_239]
MMDLTANLPLMRHNQQQAESLFRDDRVVLALGCRALIAALANARPREQIVGVATSESASLAVVERARPNLVMVSDALEEGCGITLVASLKERWPALRVLLLVMGNAHSQRLRRFLAAPLEGVAVVMDERIGTGSEMAALHSLHVGAQFVDPTLRQAVLPVCPLSGREREVLRWLVAGQSNSQIAERLQLSQETVKTHVSKVFRKLGVANRQQAALQALRLEVLEA